MGVAGAGAGIAAWLPPVYQMDVIKTRIQTQDFERPQYRGAVDCFRHVVKHEGYAVLSRGLGSAMIRAIPVNGITFAIYELTMILLADYF